MIAVSGADLMDGTPVYDIKPYLPYADLVPGAEERFTERKEMPHLQVVVPESFKKTFPEEHLDALVQVLSLDPRPAYQNDPQRVYGFVFAGQEVKFQIRDGIVYVCG